jgi:hypothetical protein
MQTFLPLPDYRKTAKVLDRRRLGKQRVEAKQILHILIGLDPDSRWRNHPAVRMWKGHEKELARYGMAICREWQRRGYKDQQLPFFVEAFVGCRSCEPPPWFGDALFHASHRSNLLRKKPEWYEQFGWTEPPDMPYVWP